MNCFAKSKHGDSSTTVHVVSAETLFIDVKRFCPMGLSIKIMFWGITPCSVLCVVLCVLCVVCCVLFMCVVCCVLFVVCCVCVCVCVCFFLSCVSVGCT